MPVISLILTGIVAFLSSDIVGTQSDQKRDTHLRLWLYPYNLKHESHSNVMTECSSCLPPDDAFSNGVWADLGEQLLRGYVLDALCSIIEPYATGLHPKTEAAFLTRETQNTRKHQTSGPHDVRDSLAGVFLVRHAFDENVLFDYLDHDWPANGSRLWATPLDVFPMPYLVSSNRPFDTSGSSAAPGTSVAIESPDLPPLDPKFLIGFEEDALFWYLRERLYNHFQGLYDFFKHSWKKEQLTFAKQWERLGGKQGDSFWDRLLQARRRDRHGEYWFSRFVTRRLERNLLTASTQQTLQAFFTSQLVEACNIIFDSLRSPSTLKNDETENNGLTWDFRRALLQNDWDDTFGFQSDASTVETFVRSKSARMWHLLETAVAVDVSTVITTLTRTCVPSSNNSDGVVCCQRDPDKVHLILPGQAIYFVKNVTTSPPAPAPEFLSSSISVCLLHAADSPDRLHLSSPAFRSIAYYAKLHGIPHLVYGLRNEFYTSPWEPKITGAAIPKLRPYYTKIVSLLDIISGRVPPQTLVYPKQDGSFEPSDRCSWIASVDFDIFMTAPWSSLRRLIREVLTANAKRSVLVFRDMNFRSSGRLLNNGVLIVRNTTSTLELLERVLAVPPYLVYEVWDGAWLSEQTGLTRVAHEKMHSARKQFFYKPNVLTHFHDVMNGSVLRRNNSSPAQPLPERMPLLMNILFFIASPWLLDSPRGYTYSDLPDNEAYPDYPVVFMSQRLANSFAICSSTVYTPPPFVRFFWKCPTVVTQLRGWIPGDFIAHYAGCDKSSVETLSPDYPYFRALFEGTSESNPYPLNWYLEQTKRFPPSAASLPQLEPWQLPRSCVLSTPSPSGPLLVEELAQEATFMSALTFPKGREMVLHNATLHSEERYYYLIFAITPQIRGKKKLYPGPLSWSTLEMLMTPEETGYPNCDGHRDFTLMDFMVPFWLTAFGLCVDLAVVCGIIIIMALLCVGHKNRHGDSMKLSGRSSRCCAVTEALLRLFHSRCQRLWHRIKGYRPLSQSIDHDRSPQELFYADQHINGQELARYRTSTRRQA